MTLIQVEGIGKTYGTTVALNDINLTLNRGEFLSIAGPSGSGKSTLLRIMDLIEEPSQGKMLFEGIDTGLESERLRLRRRIGIVFQQNMMMNTSVFENVVYPLKIRGIKSDLHREAARALEQIGLGGYENRKAISLSGGETQRLALAQALIYEPDVLLLDEPTANLDPRNSSIIEGIVSQINREDDVTVVMSTHNVTQAERLASKILILRSGRVATYDEASRVFSNPSAFLASFTEMANVFHGIATTLEEGLALIDIGDDVKLQASTKKRGHVTVYVNPDEIIVTSASAESSARNILKGKIAEITDLGQHVQLNVNCGRHFAVRITKRSFKEMGLNLESEIYLNFKASSVKVTHQTDGAE